MQKKTHRLLCFLPRLCFFPWSGGELQPCRHRPEKRDPTRPKRSLAALSLASLLGILVAQAQAGDEDDVTIEEAGWVIEADISFPSPVSALIRPDDGWIYLGTRPGDLSRVNLEGNSQLLLSTTDIAGLAYDPGTGAIFYSEDFPGDIS